MKRVAIIYSVLLLTACNGGPGKTNIELIQGMMDQKSVKAQDWNPNDPEQIQMRMPPKGTEPVGYKPYLNRRDPAAAGNERNPLAGNMSAEVLTEGRKQYDIYCAVCHGAQGKADGPVAAKMAVKPRNLIAPDALAYSDGRIYFAITAGYGVMGAYDTQITDANKRWAVVNYVRSLQKQAK